MRWVSSIWQVDGVARGAPRGRLLCRWDSASARFVWENSAVGLSASEALREERAARIQALADAGRTSRADFAGLLSAIAKT